MSVTVIGLREANRALKALPAIAKGEAQGVMDVTAFQVAREAERQAPRSKTGSHGNPPGFLASSIRWESRPRSISAVVGVAAAAFYWRFLEYGTRYITPRPFFRPAADENRADHQRRLIDALTRAGSQIAKMGRHGE